MVGVMAAGCGESAATPPRPVARAHQSTVSVEAHSRTLALVDVIAPCAALSRALSPGGGRTSVPAPYIPWPPPGRTTAGPTRLPGVETCMRTIPEAPAATADVDATAGARGEAPEARARRAPLIAGGVLFGFVVLAVLINLPIWEDPLTRYAGLSTTSDPNDAMWFLTWTPYALSHGMSPFTTDYRNYPLGLNLMWNTWMPAVAILMWPVT